MNKLTAISVQCNGQKRVVFAMLPVVTERTQFGQEREKAVCPASLYDKLCAGSQRGDTVTIG